MIYMSFFIGLILICKGGDWFVDAASKISETLGIPKYVVGATIVSFATTMPEIIVSAAAAFKRTFRYGDWKCSRFCFSKYRNYSCNQSVFSSGSNQKTGLYYKNNSIYRNPRITSDKFQRQSI